MPFGRKKAVDATQEVLDHLKLIDNVKALQEGQKQIAEALVKLNERLTSMEADMKVQKAEASHAAYKQAQEVVVSVQSEFNRRLQDVAVSIARMEEKNAILPHAPPRLIEDKEKTD